MIQMQLYWFASPYILLPKMATLIVIQQAIASYRLCSIYDQ